ncbi:Hypothetical predicted protein [Marmota monax]|uniref:Uncharacterized protein n=1 Tax=Marmota monax TaxID=9995 RepID=A0A5E4C985_MARMO|nr:hypothetical protein GHT09_016713 [Marmota monax]VTJ77930.1 Hypothetical predicted protein [Marmota monax]
MAAAQRHLGMGWGEMVLSKRSPFRPIRRRQRPLPEDGLLNISRNSTAKPVNCFLGNTLNKDGCPPAGRAESLAWTTGLSRGRRSLQAASVPWGAVGLRGSSPGAPHLQKAPGPPDFPKQ